MKRALNRRPHRKANKVGKFGGNGPNYWHTGGAGGNMGYLVFSQLQVANTISCSPAFSGWVSTRGVKWN